MDSRSGDRISLPGIRTDDLEQLLADLLERPVKLTEAEALGASSRATPWRIDVEAGGKPLSYLLRYGESCSFNEVAALRAMAEHPIPTPHVIHWDETCEALGAPVFLSELIDGTSLLPSMRAGEAWAIDLYIDTVCALQAIRTEDLPSGSVETLEAGESARAVIDAAYARLSERTDLIEAAYLRLVETQPDLPETAFSNGDLWPDNLLVRGRELVGIIDWQHAGWSDPLFEFLLPFFLVPELRGRGIEERYCERKGFDPATLHWYHGVEFFDSLCWVLKLGKPYEIHTAESLRTDLASWLDGG